MIDELHSLLTDYFQHWQSLVDEQPELQNFLDFRADAVGYKVADDVAYRSCYEELRPLCDKIVETWMNGRWIAKMHLKDSALPGDIKLIKLMQRRPGSSDALGLDHVDFICPNVTQAEQALDASTATWSWESNDIMVDYRWLSVWFTDTEAKIKEYGVIDTVIRELQTLEQ